MKKSKTKIKNICFSAAILIFVLFVFNTAEAAKLGLISQTQEISIGRQFQVNLVLDAENEEINAVEGRILFPKDLLELKEIRDGNSIINFWVEKPKIEQPGVIIFSGITPGGYHETKGFLFSIVFEAKGNGSGTVEIGSAKILLNDGKGTEANAEISPFQFFISQGSSSADSAAETVDTPAVGIIKDIDPPENFEPKIASDPDIFDGKYFLAFAAQDKGSGIDYYEIKEKRIIKIFNFELFSQDKWYIAKSPYLLKDQALKSYIFVKAVDKSGNERTVQIMPRYPLAWYENWVFWLIIILVGAISAIIAKIWRKHRKLIAKN